MLATARMARKLGRRPHCEAFYLAFSTDPGSLLQRSPEEHGVALEATGLDEGQVVELTFELRDALS